MIFVQSFIISSALNGHSYLLQTKYSLNDKRPQKIFYLHCFITHHSLLLFIQSSWRYLVAYRITRFLYRSYLLWFPSSLSYIFMFLFSSEEFKKNSTKSRINCWNSLLSRHKEHWNSKLWWTTMHASWLLFTTTTQRFWYINEPLVYFTRFCI